MNVSILQKRIQDGWWKNVEPVPTTVPIENIDFDKLVENGWVRAKDADGHALTISIVDTGLDFAYVPRFEFYGEGKK